MKFIDLFAGIGGFHLALSKLGCECVFASEIDKYARDTYKKNFNIKDEIFNNDIRKISPYEIPNHDILCAGFPCQPFSQAGYKRGFSDMENSERGSLFFCIADILKAKRPRAFILENVRYLINHSNGETFRTICDILSNELNYSIFYKVIKASDFGRPQHRPRVYIVGFSNESILNKNLFNFPDPIPLNMTMSDIWEGECNKKIGYTLRVGGRGSPIEDRRNWDGYVVNDKIVRLGPIQAKRMMGFPDNFILSESTTQSMKQLGNSVCVDVVYNVAKQVLNHMSKTLIKIPELHNNDYSFMEVLSGLCKENMPKQYTIAETFAGAGGSHLGFKNNGFKTVYINEWSKDCIKTLKHNNPEIFKNAIVDNKDINEIDLDFLSQKLKNKVDILFGGVVCKGFSLAGEKSPVDDRNYLYKKQLQLVEALQPKISIIENVPALLNAKIVKQDIDDKIKQEIIAIYNALEKIKGAKANMRKKNILTKEEDKKTVELRRKKKEILRYLEKNNMLISVMDDIKNIYDKLGYKVYYNILNATWYGSATARDRIVIVAVKKEITKEYIFPIITHFDSAKNKSKVNIPIKDKCKKITTTGDALSIIDYNNKNDIDNLPMQHNQKTVERFSYIPEGGNIQDVINKIPKELHISKFYSRGCTMRLDRNKPSPTLVPGHSNFPVHPIENRSITVREAATITGFPLDYKFFGSHTSRCEQVGNAVPVHLSNAIAKSVKEFLDSL